MNKEVPMKAKVIFAPDVAKFKMELFGNKAVKDVDYSADKHRQKAFNDVLPQKKDIATPMDGIRRFHSILNLIWLLFIYFLTGNWSWSIRIELNLPFNE